MVDTLEQHQLARLEGHIDALARYVEQRSWIGYDPYDLKAHPLYLRLIRRRLTAVPAKAAVNLFPLALRRLLRVHPLPHAKAMALFAEAYLNRFDQTGDSSYRRLAEDRLRWLRQNHTPGFSGLAWGLPFNFQGRDWVAAGTPSVVITTIAANSFLHAWQSLGNSTWLDAAVSACHFLATDIPRYQAKDGGLCFSKMTGVQWNVHNANLMVAATLAKVGQAAGRSEWESLVEQAARYTLSAQRDDGSWYYWGPPNPSMRWIDHYHTGFVLRALDDLRAATGWTRLDLPLEQGYQFYTQRLFDSDNAPRLTDKSRYPIDIHSCAEAIWCLSQLSGQFDDALERALNVTQWTLNKMRHPDGYFYYRQYRWGLIKIPYMRWGQAWMFASLTHLQKTLQSTTEKETV